MPPADGRSAGAAVAPLLESLGVDVIFGIPGVHNVELYRGLHDTGLRHVLARHEQGAGFMADGYARATGRPGVCFVISGPGLTNVATPMGQAFSDSVPMLVIGAVRETGELGRRARGLHEIGNQLQVAEALSGYCATVLTAADLPAQLAAAWNAMTQSRPRPAFLELPLDVMVAPYEAAGPLVTGARSPATVSSADIERAAQLLAGAARPVLIAGGGAIGASQALRELVERYAVAVLPTIAGKGIVPDDHGLSVGSLLPQPAALEWLGSADVVLAVGTELAPTDSWHPAFPINGELIRIDVDPELFAGEYEAVVSIEADANVAMTAVLDAMARANLDSARLAARSEALAAEIAALQSRIRSVEDDERQTHRAVLEAVRAAIPQETAVFTDMTLLAYSGNEVFPVQSPRQWFHPVGYGTLGYAVPAAMGAKFALGDRPVIAIAGDYGFGYTSQELTAAAEHRLPLPVIIWNSENLGAIEYDMRRKNIPPTEVVALNPDFERLAAAYHCGYARPSNLSAFKESVRNAFEHAAPTLIEIGPAMVRS